MCGYFGYSCFFIFYIFFGYFFLSYHFSSLLFRLRVAVDDGRKKEGGKGRYISLALTLLRAEKIETRFEKKQNEISLFETDPHILLKNGLLALVFFLFLGQSRHKGTRWVNPCKVSISLSLRFTQNPFTGTGVDGAHAINQ